MEALCERITGRTEEAVHIKRRLQAAQAKWRHTIIMTTWWLTTRSKGGRIHQRDHRS